MKLKNVVVGSEIEVKHDTKFFTKGEVVKVLYKEDSDCEDSSTLKLENSKGEILWSNHEYFRRPRLKTQDQSIFDGVDSRYSYFAIDKDGRGGFYDQKPELCGEYFTSGYGWHQAGQYDASNWQNSLIERESKELTGSELCKAMLARGDEYVVCLVSNVADSHAINHREHTTLIEQWVERYGFYNYRSQEWGHAVPANPATNEPLTAKDVGL